MVPPPLKERRTSEHEGDINAASIGQSDVRRMMNHTENHSTTANKTYRSDSGSALADIRGLGVVDDQVSLDKRDRDRDRISHARFASTISFSHTPLRLPTPTHLSPWPEVLSRGQTSLDSASNTSNLKVCTIQLLEVFRQCDPTYVYDQKLNPKRVLTKPSQPAHNSDFDNEKHDYILYVNDVIGNDEGHKYLIMDLLGQGTFGQVVKCQNLKTKELVAVKVIKNQPAYFNQSMTEVTVLEMLNEKFDKDDRRHIIRFKDMFIFRQHLCIIVELLSLNLFDLIKQNQYRGFSLQLCRIFLAQTLDAMMLLKEAKIIHCDLKPENILLKNLDTPAIKVIDFGSACHEQKTIYTYIQSRFYRSPEVLFGLPYSSSIDMWSLGCIAAELFLGLPIFPGASNYDQVSRIVESIGMPPSHMLEVGKDAHYYFEKRMNSDGKTCKFALKPRERYALERNRVENPSRRYFSSITLEDIVTNYTMRPKTMTVAEKEREVQHRQCFLDFVKGCLSINPVERWSPYQAMQHPFITGRPFSGHFIPPMAPITVPVAQPPLRPEMRIKPQKNRPRANTMSSLSLQEVPPQLQRLAAVSKGNGPPGEMFERSIPEVNPNDSSYIENSSDEPFQGVAYSPYAYEQSGHASSSYGQSPTTRRNNRQLTDYHTHTMQAYLNNRRISNPPLSYGTIGRNRHQSTLVNPDPNSQMSSSGGNFFVGPSSMPAGAYYHVAPPYLNEASPSHYQGQRRQSRRNSSRGEVSLNDMSLSTISSRSSVSSIGSAGNGKPSMQPSPLSNVHPEMIEMNMGPSSALRRASAPIIQPPISIRKHSIGGKTTSPSSGLAASTGTEISQAWIGLDSAGSPGLFAPMMIDDNDDNDDQPDQANLNTNPSVTLSPNANPNSLSSGGTRVRNASWMAESIDLMDTVDEEAFGDSGDYDTTFNAAPGKTAGRTPDAKL